MREVTVSNGNICYVESKQNEKPMENKDSPSNNFNNNKIVHTNGCVNNAYIATKDEKLEKMHEPPTADPEDVGGRPFHGHTPSMFFNIFPFKICNILFK